VASYFTICASKRGSRVCFKISFCLVYNWEQFCAEHKPLTIVSVTFASLSSPAGRSLHDRQFILRRLFSVYRRERLHDPVPGRTGPPTGSNISDTMWRHDCRHCRCTRLKDHTGATSAPITCGAWLLKESSVKVTAIASLLD